MTRRFAADSMLGGLARWLRVLGYDATWEARIDDDELVRRAAAEERLVLTRDAALAARHPGGALLRIVADDPMEQLREIDAREPLRREAAFTRCSRCNAALLPVPPDQAGDAVPADIRAAGRPIQRCPLCRRMYWDGSHTARMREALAWVQQNVTPAAGPHPAA